MDQDVIELVYDSGSIIRFLPPYSPVLGGYLLIKDIV